MGIFLSLLIWLFIGAVIEFLSYIFTGIMRRSYSQVTIGIVTIIFTMLKMAALIFMCIKWVDVAPYSIPIHIIVVVEIVWNLLRSLFVSHHHHPLDTLAQYTAARTVGSFVFAILYVLQVI